MGTVDVAATALFARKVYKKCRDCQASAYRNLGSTIRQIQNTLEDISDAVQAHPPDDLQDLINACNEVLEDLSTLVDDCNNSSVQARRASALFRLDQRPSQDIEKRLGETVELVKAFYGKIQDSPLVQAERALRHLATDIEYQRFLFGLVEDLDNEASWTTVFSDLEALGVFPEEASSAQKDFVVDWILRAIAEKSFRDENIPLEEHPPETGIALPRQSVPIAHGTPEHLPETDTSSSEESVPIAHGTPEVLPEVDSASSQKSIPAHGIPEHLPETDTGSSEESIPTPHGSPEHLPETDVGSSQEGTPTAHGSPELLLEIGITPSGQSMPVAHGMPEVVATLPSTDSRPVVQDLPPEPVILSTPPTSPASSVSRKPPLPPRPGPSSPALPAVSPPLGKDSSQLAQSPPVPGTSLQAPVNGPPAPVTDPLVPVTAPPAPGIGPPAPVATPLAPGKTPLAPGNTPPTPETTPPAPGASPATKSSQQPKPSKALLSADPSKGNILINAQRICYHWNRREWKQAKSFIEAQIECVELGQYVEIDGFPPQQPSIRVLRHLLGISLSFLGAYEAAKRIFQISLKDDRGANSLTRSAGIAAYWWLGDTCLILNEPENAALAWAIAASCNHDPGVAARILESIRLVNEQSQALETLCKEYEFGNGPTHWIIQRVDREYKLRVVLKAMQELERVPPKDFKADWDQRTEITEDFLLRPRETLQLWPFEFDPFFHYDGAIRMRRCFGTKKMNFDLSSVVRSPVNSSKAPLSLDFQTKQPIEWLVEAVRYFLIAHKIDYVADWSAYRVRLHLTTENIAYYECLSIQFHRLYKKATSWLQAKNLGKRGFEVRLDHSTRAFDFARFVPAGKENCKRDAEVARKEAVRAKLANGLIHYCKQAEKDFVSGNWPPKETSPVVKIIFESGRVAGAESQSMAQGSFYIAELPDQVYR